MRYFCAYIVYFALCVFLTPVISLAEPPLLGAEAAIDQLLSEGIRNGLISGGVVVVGDKSGTIATAAKGTRENRAGGDAIDSRTIFDLASLTKVLATTPAVMKLIDDKKISLNDPIVRWFPEFKGQRDITVLHLLTHTSGLSDFNLHAWQGMKTAVSKAAHQYSRPIAGTYFNYADINFILLGEMVRRVSGSPLDVFCRDYIYRPIGANDTMFTPPASLRPRIAPTSGGTNGVVQDANARRLGGVAGHAGLFSTTQDISLIAKLILNKGAFDGRRVWSEQTVQMMTSPYLCSNGKVVRALGWDMNSPYSAPKGEFSDSSFGHTGYSGSSIWIDPVEDRFVVLLTNRTNYREVGLFNQLRHGVSMLSSEAPAAWFGQLVLMQKVPTTPAQASVIRPQQSSTRQLDVRKLLKGKRKSSDRHKRITRHAHKRKTRRSRA